MCLMCQDQSSRGEGRSRSGCGVVGVIISIDLMLGRVLAVLPYDRPWVAQTSELCLSVATGIFFILHGRYYEPLLSDQGAFSLYSALFSLSLVSLLKLALMAPLAAFCSPRPKKAPSIPLSKLIYPTIVKLGTYLSVILLLSVVRYLSFALTMCCTLVFILSLHFCSLENRNINSLWKGRPLSSNKIKVGLLYLLVVVGLGLQPLEYAFNFQLHFEIFIVFTTCLLIFSFYYLHKLAVAVISRTETAPLLLRQMAIESVCLGLLILYYNLLEDSGMSILDQLAYMWSHPYLLGLLVGFNLFYELIFLEMIRKLALNRLVITQITGLLWYNVYTMAKQEIQLKLYVSVIIMSFVLIVNMGLCSEQNMKSTLEFLATTKKKKKRTTLTEMEIKNSESQH